MGNTEKLAKVYREIINEMLKRRESGRNINRYEYFKYGGVPFRDAAHTMYQLVREKKITLSEYTMVKEFTDRQSNIFSTRNKETILSTHYQYGDVVISDEEKMMIWNQLCKLTDESNIDDLVFSGAVREYALMNGLIKEKEPTGKKR